MSMPYFLYKILPKNKLSHIQTFAGFQPAKAQARALRAQMTPEDDYRIKIVFASTQTEAETLLTTAREAPTLREDEL
jgi:hypothetical protein